MLRKGLVKMAMEFHIWNAGPALHGHRQWKPSPGPAAVSSGPGDTAASVHGAPPAQVALAEPHSVRPRKACNQQPCP